MASSSGGSGAAAFRKPKKVNLLNRASVKHILDESVSEVAVSKGYVKDVRISNLKMLIGSTSIVIALSAQFYPKKFPQNRDFLIVCVVFGKYLVSSGMLMLISYLKEKDAILFTYPPSVQGYPDITGLVISSKLPRCSDIYTLIVASTEPKSVFAKRPVQLSKSVTKWFTDDGCLVEGLFWKDVERLIGDYSRDLKKTDVTCV